jgi:hypothetical protein
MAVGLDVLEHSHGVCLSRSSLTIHKVGAAVPIQHIEHQRETSLFKYLGLRCGIVKYFVKPHLFRRFFGDGQLDMLRVLRVNEAAAPLGVHHAAARVEHRVLNL